MHIQADMPLGAHNTLRLEACAKAYAQVANDAEIQEALAWARTRDLEVLPLGEGSNLVLASDLQMLVMQIVSRGITRLSDADDKVELRVAAGENWHQFVQWTLSQGFCGLENLALIPGAVGAAPVQNIGAYGVELCQFVKAVHYVDLVTGKCHHLTARECEFAYRDSVFKNKLCDRAAITAVEFSLSRTPHSVVEYPALAEYLAQNGISPRDPKAVFNAVVAIRSKKLPDPVQVPNAGSFFKNPIVGASQAGVLAAQYEGMPAYAQPDGRFKLAAAWLIEQCGWKGREQNGVRVHPDHALVLTNTTNTSGKILLEYAEEIRADVASKFSVHLKIEPRVYGECNVEL